jgi:hypothetical protein
MAGEKIIDFQKQTLEMLRAQQDAYLDAVKAWREALAAGMQLPQPPQPPQWTPPADFGSLPSASEMTELSYAFASKLLADQSRFMEELSKAMGGVKGKT